MCRSRTRTASASEGGGYQFLLLFPDSSHHGDFSAIVELPKGTHEYKFYVDGKWIHDPCAVSGFMTRDSLYQVLCGRFVPLVLWLGDNRQQLGQLQQCCPCDQEGL